MQNGGMSQTLVVVVVLIVVTFAVLRFRCAPPRYRATEAHHLEELRRLRSLALRSVGGLPHSRHRTIALWRLWWCTFVARTPEEAEDGQIALTLDKGREIHICVDRADRQALDYVLLHEVAHVMTRTVGHTPEFERNMDALLASARRQGLYTGASRRVVFCGASFDLHD